VRGEHWSERRLAGVTEVARQLGRAVPVHAPGRSWERSQERLAGFIRSLPRPVGLVACNDIHGLRALDACRRAGVVVPEEVAVVGADDDAELCELSDPPLTSVAFNPERVGYDAAAALDRMMRGERVPRRRVLVPPLGVVARQSTEPLAVDDPLVARALNFVRRHACDGINVGSVLAEVPLSRRALEHRFRKRLGRSIKAEIRRLQMDRVKSLLAETDLPIAQISDQLGFHQPAYLSVVFKQETGQTPASYRRQARRGGGGGGGLAPGG
jgi:LacI family transcriptional regulator